MYWRLPVCAAFAWPLSLPFGRALSLVCSCPLRMFPFATEFVIPTHASPLLNVLSTFKKHIFLIFSPRASRSLKNISKQGIGVGGGSERRCAFVASSSLGVRATERRGRTLERRVHVFLPGGVGATPGGGCGATSSGGGSYPSRRFTKGAHLASLSQPS